MGGEGLGLKKGNVTYQNMVKSFWWEINSIQRRKAKKEHYFICNMGMHVITTHIFVKTKQNPAKLSFIAPTHSKIQVSFCDFYYVLPSL